MPHPQSSLSSTVPGYPWESAPELKVCQPVLCRTKPRWSSEEEAQVAGAQPYSRLCNALKMNFLQGGAPGPDDKP